MCPANQINFHWVTFCCFSLISSQEEVQLKTYEKRKEKRSIAKFPICSSSTWNGPWATSLWISSISSDLAGDHNQFPLWITLDSWPNFLYDGSSGCQLSCQRNMGPLFPTLNLIRCLVIVLSCSSFPHPCVRSLGTGITPACQQISIISCQPNDNFVPICRFSHPCLNKMIGSMLSFVFNDLHNFTDKYLLYACDLLVAFANYALCGHLNLSQLCYFCLYVNKI